MTFAGSIFLIVAGVVGLLIAIWQCAVWSRRSRQSEILVDDRPPFDPGYREPPPADRRDPHY